MWEMNSCRHQAITTQTKSNVVFQSRTRAYSMVCFYISPNAACVLPRWHRNRSTPWRVPAEAPVLAVRGWFRMSSKWNVSWRQTCYSHCGRKEAREGVRHLIIHVIINCFFPPPTHVLLHSFKYTLRGETTSFYHCRHTELTEQV